MGLMRVLAWWSRRSSLTTAPDTGGEHLIQEGRLAALGPGQTAPAVVEQFSESPTFITLKQACPRLLRAF